MKLTISSKPKLLKTLSRFEGIAIYYKQIAVEHSCNTLVAIEQDTIMIVIFVGKNAPQYICVAVEVIYISRQYSQNPCSHRWGSQWYHPQDAHQNPW